MRRRSMNRWARDNPTTTIVAFAGWHVVIWLRWFSRSPFQQNFVTQASCLGKARIGHDMAPTIPACDDDACGNQTSGTMTEFLMETKPASHPSVPDSVQSRGSSAGGNGHLRAVVVASMGSYHRTHTRICRSSFDRSISESRELVFV